MNAFSLLVKLLQNFEYVETCIIYIMDVLEELDSGFQEVAHLANSVKKFFRLAWASAFLVS